MCQQAITELFKAKQIGILAIQESTDIFYGDQDDLSENGIGRIYHKNGTGLLWDETKYALIAKSITATFNYTTADFLCLETKEFISVTSAHIAGYDLLAARAANEQDRKELVTGSVQCAREVIQAINNQERPYAVAATIIGADTNSIPDIDVSVHTVFAEAGLEYTPLGQPTNYHHQESDTDSELVERALDDVFATSKPTEVGSHFELNNAENPSDHIAVTAMIAESATNTISRIIRSIWDYLFLETVDLKAIDQKSKSLKLVTKNPIQVSKTYKKIGTIALLGLPAVAIAAWNMLKK